MPEIAVADLDIAIPLCARDEFGRASSFRLDFRCHVLLRLPVARQHVEIPTSRGARVGAISPLAGPLR
jgi:hypothetical protein